MGRRPCSSPSGGKLRTWRRGPASRQGGCWNAWRPSVNTDELEHQLYRAERRVREIQTKLHRWATDDPTGLVESRMPGQRARPVREATRRNPPVETLAGRSGSTSLRQGCRPVNLPVPGG